jgi:N-acetylmuramoyl-L-alanine amidase
MIKGLIDPGHGGNDRANKGKNGYIEADGVLKISKYLKAELEKTGQFAITLTRDTDKTLSLTERGKMAKGYDFFISEHTNAGGSAGTEVFYSVDIPKDKVFADKLSKAIADTLGIVNRGSKTRESKNYPGEDYYTVIDTAQDIGCPHVFIIESAFHDNLKEEALLLNDENLLKIAQAQAQVICEYYGVNTLSEEQQTELAIDKLFRLGIITSPTYWKNRAKVGEIAPGEWVAILIRKMADYIE